MFHLSRYQKGVGIAILSAVCAGMWPSAAKATYLSGGNQTFVIIASTAVRAVVLVFFSLCRGHVPFANTKYNKNSIFGGLLQAISICCMAYSVTYLPGPIAILIYFIHTILLLFLLAWRKEMKITFPVVGLTVLALFGLSFVLNVWGHDSSLSARGVLLAATACVIAAGRLYRFGKETALRHPALVGAENMSAAAFFTLPLLLLTHVTVPDTSQGWGWFALASFSLATATVGMFYGIAYLGSFRFSMLMKLEPICTSCWSILFIGEYLTAGQYAGIAVVLFALISFQFLEKVERARAAIA